MIQIIIGTRVLVYQKIDHWGVVLYIYRQVITVFPLHVGLKSSGPEGPDRPLRPLPVQSPRPRAGNNARDKRVSNWACSDRLTVRIFLHLLLSISFRSPHNLARSSRHTDLGSYLSFLTRRVRYRRFNLLGDFFFRQRWRLSQRMLWNSTV